MHSYKQLIHLSAATLGLAALVACDSELPPGSGPGDPDALRIQFEAEVETKLVQVCGGCHGFGAPAQYEFVGFLKTGPDAPEVFDAIFDWQVGPMKFDLIDRNNPLSSPLITKGNHAGRAWTEDEITEFTPWLNAVKEAFDGPPDENQTRPVTPARGRNVYDLGELGLDDLAGNKLHINYDLSGGLLYLLSIEIEAGPNGVVLDTLYVGIIAGDEPDAVFDPINAFAGVVTNAAPNERKCIGQCSLIGSWVAPHILSSGTVQLVFSFAEYETSGTGDDPDGAGGCQDVPYFYANVVPEFQARNCTNCHGAGGNSTVYLDNLAATDEADRKRQCDNILSRTNFDSTDPDHLLILSATAATHPNVVGDLTTLDAALDAFVATEEAAAAN